MLTPASLATRVLCTDDKSACLYQGASVLVFRHSVCVKVIDTYLLSHDDAGHSFSSTLNPGL